MTKSFNNIIFPALFGWLVQYTGGLDGPLHALIVVMIANYITGLMCAINSKTVSCSVVFKGIYHKVLIILLVGIANIMDRCVVNVDNILRTSVILYYISKEGLSMLDNLTQQGVPIPEKLKEILKLIMNGL